MKTVLILGSTGSIGKSTLEVLDLHKENFKCIGLSANKNFQALHEQANQYSVKNICIQECSPLKTDIEKNSDIKIYRGSDGQSEMIRDLNADIVVIGISGAIGLEATHEAIKTGKRVLIANKEPLVMCGEFLLNEAKKYQSEIIPLDSEHSAIFQCLQGSSKDDVNKIILCCSGGPFWDKKIESFEKITVQDALNHPIWKMGEKISIDSSTLMNKSLEIIEASVLFGVDANKIDVVIHPQHIVHSMVEFKDGSILSNLSAPDMKASISYGLGFPKRLESGIERLSFSDLFLNFFEPDHKKFPTLDYAKKALSLGGNLPLILNSFNEVAVDLFLQEKINYLDIFQLISHAFDAKDNLDINKKFDTVDEILHLEALSKKQAKVYAERYTF
jgi:1-deoxy-D-xylulose-5-phosphate reductoisomerase